MNSSHHFALEAIPLYLLAARVLGEADAGRASIPL